MTQQRKTLREFAKDLITAGMMMQPLDLNYGMDSPAGELLGHMEDQDFDYFVIAVEEDGPHGVNQYRTLRYVLQPEIKERIKLDAEKAGQPLYEALTNKQLHRNFPSDRILSEQTALGEVATLIHEGGATATARLPVLIRTSTLDPDWHIISVADFSAPAGLAATMCMIQVVDARLAEEISGSIDEEQAKSAIDPERWKAAAAADESKKKWNESTGILNCLSFNDRLEIYKKLLADGNDEGLENLNTTRNGVVHGRNDEVSGEQALDAFMTADRILDALG